MCGDSLGGSGVAAASAQPAFSWTCGREGRSADVTFALVTSGIESSTETPHGPGPRGPWMGLSRSWLRGTQRHSMSREGWGSLVTWLPTGLPVVGNPRVSLSRNNSEAGAKGQPGARPGAALRAARTWARIPAPGHWSGSPRSRPEPRLRVLGADGGLVCACWADALRAGQMATVAGAHVPAGQAVHPSLRHLERMAVSSPAGVPQLPSAFGRECRAPARLGAR